MPRDDPEEEEAPENVWLGLARDLLVAGVIVAVFLASMYAYAGTWPPLVVVESSSMQHSGQESFLGVIDTGDMVFQQAAPTRSSIITYIGGRASGYSTYGDYGDVIIFNRPGDPTPVIHRAIMYVTIRTNGTADVPDLALLTSDWSATDDAGLPTTSPYFVQTVTIHNMGFNHRFNITFDFRTTGSLVRFAPRSGYVTMGDQNAYLACAISLNCGAPPNRIPYDYGWMPRQSDVIGRARGEIPWFGLLKLTLSPTDSCCYSWGDPEAPKNSWDSLIVGLIFLFALPFLLEFAGRGWTKYVAPRLPKVRWPWRRKGPGADGPREWEKRPPREGSSGP